MREMTEKRREELMAVIRERRTILETSVTAIVGGFQSAMFVWGPPGLGKSHLLTSILDAVAGRGWVHHTAHSTPRALFMSLAENPAAVHLYEDCEKLLKTDLSASILRAACGSPNDRERWVTYETANEKMRIRVTGGVIIATNQNLSRTNGPLQGVASRFRPLKWDLSLEERIATIMTIASVPHTKGGVGVTVKEAKMVARALCEMVADCRSEMDLDIRLYTEHALPAYAQAKQAGTGDWQSIMQAKLVGVATTVADTQEARTRHLQQLAQKINLEGGTTKDKVAKWKQLTGLGQSIFYRHLKCKKA